MAVTEQELRKIQESIGKEKYADYVYAQYVLGIRPGVFVTLKKADVRMDGSRMVLSIGNHQVIPVQSSMQEIIERRLDQPGTDLLFPRADIRRGVWLGWKPLTLYYYNRNILQPLMQKLNI